MDATILGWIAGIGIPLAYVLGVLSALDAVMKTRTAQGATAWVLALTTIPFISLPLYWVFGRVKFDGYAQALRNFDLEVQRRLKDARQDVLADVMVHPENEKDLRSRAELVGFRDLATVPFTEGNGARLLIDGISTFNAIFKGIDTAEAYVLVQFYIIRDDDIGRQFKQKLIAAAQRGVRVYLLYDEVGSYKLARSYLRDLKKGGVQVSRFSGKRSWLGRFRLNFRNHRKIVVVDGKKGYVGGLNVGDEYLGRDPKISPWRDTHLAIEGPAVQGLQLSFLRDWYYGLQEIPEVHWDFSTHEKNQPALVLASSPADTLETCSLLYAHAIESAEERVWIATPYFVPDGLVLGALQLAALRGVDVRILMPKESDSILFKYVPYAYLPDVERAGVKVFLYEKGFMHQKVMLIDDDYATVGTANFDNRSFRLNFEVTCMVNDTAFCAEVAAMLQHDLHHATQLTGDDLADRSLAFRFATQTTRLLAPVL